LDPLLYFDHNELFHNTAIIKLINIYWYTVALVLYTNSHSASPMFI